MNKRSILRALSAVALLAGAVAAFDFTPFIQFMPDALRPLAAGVAMVALAVKEIAVVVGDSIDNNKRDDSFTTKL